MARSAIPGGEVQLSFPKAGIDQQFGYSRQPPAQMPGGEYGATCILGTNVRAFEGAGDRARGGSRTGLTAYVSAAVIADWVIQELHQVTFPGTPGMSQQTNSSGRIVNLVAVSKGKVYYSTAGEATWTEATNNSASTPALNSTGIVRSAVNNLKLWFVDGNHYRYYNPDGNTVETWTAAAGALPVDSDSNKCRLICTWRGRTVLSGLLLDPQNWFMSAADDPTDFDYSPSSTTPTQAVAGNLAPQGLIGDVVTSMCPYSDDILVFFGDHSIYMLRGDPMAGGVADLITDKIGGTWGICWEKDPYGVVWFMSNQGDIYRLVPGQGAPVRVSQPIDQLLDDINTGESTVRLLWSDRYQGLHVFVTPTASAAAATHYFHETRTGAWWKDVYANNDHNPLCCYTFDGNQPTDRVALIGSWDGYVRSVDDDTAEDDDGTAIASSVWIGPVLTAILDDVLFKDIQAVLGETSGSVTWAVHVGSTAEEAYGSTAVLTGTWSAGRNLTNLIRRAGHAIYIKISATSRWSLEQIRMRIEAKGKVRRRGY